MKKLYVLAALLMTSTAAHAGNSVSLDIGGHKIRIEAPKNCEALSCLQISAPSLSGSGLSFNGFKSSGDDDDVASRADPPAQKPASAPRDQAAAPQPPVAATSSAASAPAAVASTSPAPTVSENIAPVASPPPRPSSPPLPPRRFKHRPRRSAYGTRKKTRGRFASSTAGKTFAAMPCRAARKFSST